MHKRIPRSELRIVEQHSNSTSKIPPQQADVLLTGASWDSRCVANLDVTFDGLSQVHVLTFEDPGSNGQAIKNLDEMIEWSRSQRLPISQQLLIPRSSAENWKAVRSSLIRAYEDLKRPITVAIDLNSVPRYISLSVLGFGAKSGIVESCVAIYSSATGYVYSSGNTERFTNGEWMPVSVGLLSSGGSPSGLSHMIVSAGFEGASTRRLVAALEPDRVSVIFAEGIIPRQADVSRRENVLLAEDYSLGVEDIYVTDGLDVRATIGTLADIVSRGSTTSENAAPEFTSFVLSGPKTIALAMGIVALDQPISHVYYPQPDSHAEADVLGVGETVAVRVRL